MHTQRILFNLVYLALTGFSLNTQAEMPDLSGTYTHPRVYRMYIYRSQQACEANNGNWLGQDGCEFISENRIVLTRREDSFFAPTYTLSIGVLGATGQPCMYEGIATYGFAPNELISTDPESGCSLRVRYHEYGNSGHRLMELETNHWSVDSRPCRYYCGSGATLDYSGIYELSMEN